MEIMTSDVDKQNSIQVSITVNGQTYSLLVDREERLLQVLRDRLNLTGTKNGCSKGHCGACTVVLNGKAVRACLMRPDKYNNSEIITIEGLAKGYDLHPIQQAFIDATAVQCGFCTPGIIMELYALFEKKPNTTKEEVIKALKGHLCRCTGYQPILDAAKLAQNLIQKRL